MGKGKKELICVFVNAVFDFASCLQMAKRGYKIQNTQPHKTQPHNTCACMQACTHTHRDEQIASHSLIFLGGRDRARNLPKFTSEPLGQINFGTK